MAYRNRLNLDFSLDSSEKRSRFLESYLASLDFTPNQTELMKMADYVLWGDKPAKASTLGLDTAWKPAENASLDELRETPGFNESQIYALGEAPRTKVVRQNFSRAEARAHLDASLLPSLESLWHEIDAIDYEIGAYEKLHAKRDSIRAELIERLPAQEREALETKAALLSQYAYLKLRRLLIEKRREQYAFRDTYATKIQRHSVEPAAAPDSFAFDADVLVRPASLPYATPLARAIYAKELAPSLFSEKDQVSLSSLLWRDLTPNTFDFANEDHVAQLLQLWEDLDESLDSASLDSTLGLLMRALTFYKEKASLSPVYDAILTQKLARVPNAKIRTSVNTAFNKTYSENYISTIYRKKIIPAIADAARLHREELENIFFPENWKKCNRCGRTLLMNTAYFMRKAQSADGFAPSCKRCDKAKRDAAKEKKNENAK